MDVQFGREKGALIARPSGEIDLGSADSFRKSLEEALEGSQAVNMVVNLEKVSYIDSSGLGVLLGRYKKLSRAGGRIFIVGARPNVKKVLEISGLLSVMMNFASEADALQNCE